jgi:signal transduction histidine kinase
MSSRTISQAIEDTEVKAVFHDSAGSGSGPTGIRDAAELRGLLHDLGHDLLTVSCLAQSVLSDTGISEKTRRRVSLIGQETTRLMELVRTTGGTAQVPAVVDVRELLREIATLADQANTVSVTVLPGETVLLHTDEQTLWRMLTNLVGNAVRAAGAERGPGTVELTVTRSTVVAIEVSDNGAGFGCGDGAPNGWMSLGLAIVSGLAGRIGARVLTSRREPRGTTVRLEFPAEDGGVR